MQSQEASAPRGSPPAAANELADLFSQHRERLERMVHMRMDRRVRARIDPADVLQDAFLEAAARYESYRAKPDMPLFLWLRFIVGQRLLILHRQHLGVQARDAGREVSLYRGAMPEATSQSLAAQLLGRNTSTSHVAMRAELQVRLQEVLNNMDEIDREVLALRHFEQLSNVRYMSPERFSGRADTRSDIYGLGVTLYEMLVLRPPFEAADRARL